MKILIVDDIKGWRDYHSFVLSNLFLDAEIQLAESAREAYDLLIQNNAEPFDIILTDMQMENDFEPKYAGEWFIEQIKTFKSHLNTKIIISSAAYNIKNIAEEYGVEYLPKSRAVKFPQAYEALIN